MLLVYASSRRNRSLPSALPEHSSRWPFLPRRIGALTIALLLVACEAPQRHESSVDPAPANPLVIVVCPVVNLTGAQDFDPLAASDTLASEFLAFPDISVIPVNLTLAALARRGKTRVESAADALDLAREFNADATVVTAITEYDPYDPPVVSLVMQWYAAHPPGAWGPHTSAGQVPGGEAEQALSGGARTFPDYQVQRVFNAAHESVLKELKAYAAKRDGQAGPYDWRRYAKSQDLYVRYCSWAMIRTMLAQNGFYRAAWRLSETDS